MSRRRLLFVTSKSPYDVLGGRGIRLLNMAKILARRYAVDLLTQEELPALLPRDDPFGDRTAILARKGTGRVAFDLLIHGTSVAARYESPTVKSWLREHEREYDLVFASYIHGSANLLSLTVPLVVDLIDCIPLHYREARGAGPLRRAVYWVDAAPARRLEEKIIGKAQAAFITSTRELEYLASYLPGDLAAKIHVVPNGVELPPAAPPPLSGGTAALDGGRAARGTGLSIAFLGRMDYYPNVQAAELLVREVFLPLRKRFPSLTCAIIGADPTDRIQRLERHEGVSVTGRVDDLGEALAKVDVVVLPMQVASGVQNKLLTALAYGRAVVAPPRALVDSYPFERGVNVAVASSLEEFRTVTAALLADREKREALGAAGRELMRRHASWDTVAEKVLRVVDSVLAGSRA